MPFLDVFEPVLVFLHKNWLLVVLGIICFVFISDWLKKLSKPKFKVIDRAEIEKNKFIERNKLNTTIFKFLWRKDELLGRIKTMRPDEIDGKKALEFVIQRVLNFRFFKINNVFSKLYCLIIYDDPEIIKDFEHRYIELPQTKSFTQYLGIYYDTIDQEKLLNYVKVYQLTTDLESMASIYYKHSQDQSTFNPEFAHEVLMKQQEIELEEKKRLAKLTG